MQPSLCDLTNNLNQQLMNTLDQWPNCAAQPDFLEEHITAAAEDLWEQLMPFILTLSKADEEEGEEEEEERG